MTRRLRFLFLALGLGVVLIAPHVHAAGLVVSCDTKPLPDNTGFSDPCTVDVFITQFITLSQYALTLVLFLGALMMVYGGFQFITAGGRASKIDEGKRVILGTIVGIIISFTAFVIVNFAVATITGSALAAHNINPFGAIAKVFVNPADKNISRGFNTTGEKNGVNNCHSDTSGWDKNCDPLQVHCADTSSTVGTIHTYQQVLNNKGCYATGSSNAIDGCFGGSTLDAVRRFQIASNLVPTGQIDAQTKNLLDNPTVSKNCNTPQSTLDEVNAVDGQLPAATDSSESPTDTGCCIVHGGAINFFCANQVSRRTCLAQGGDFKEGVTSCASDPASNAICGYCADNRDQQCFQTVSNFWCTNIVRDSSDPAFRMTFVPGRDCHGESACANGCSNELLNMPP